ncbi:hypothetical protein FDENT_5499 [Fusarium denticulatum]|uniref:Uncharacterized protein n=1 Tax=Fusarium denticulatum TaxID=48507 RepID=A0A8H5UB06_9HYPO|nr:hypothetical protein FDENT_5499 [Fusarium denticulatum]
MAAAAVQTYTPASYDHRAVDAMTDVDVAAQRLQELNGLDHMKSCIRDVFMKHGVDKVFGVGLLHRHYDVAPNEKIIELGPVSSPWVVGDDEVITGGAVLPHTWRVFDGELKPTEFKFVPQRELSNVDRPVFPATFVKELIGVLQETGLDEVLGVSLYEAGDPDNETMEVTYGRSSIVIPSTGLIGSKVIGPQGFDAFQAAWTFSKKEGEDIVAHHGICAAMGVGDGVTARHGICAAKFPEDGLKAHHGICAAKAIADGVTSRHGICAAKVADDGMTARHGICAAKADDGFAARHGICAAKASKDGINARHGICAARTAEDGIKARHGICAAKVADEGMTTRHGICAARLANGDVIKV